MEGFMQLNLTRLQTKLKADMVSAWLMDDAATDQRLPHQKVPNVVVSMKDLKELGLLTWKIDADNFDTNQDYAKIKKDRGYNYEDEVTCSSDKLPNYKEKLKSFFKEHIHDEEEVRFVLDGTGYFDVRNKEDKWIRISVEKGDLITLPAGIYHRFTLDEKNFIKVKRLFRGVPIWTPINRPADDHPARTEYVKSVSVK